MNGSERITASMPTLSEFFEQFVRERTYVSNVTPKTQDWYRDAWRAFQRSQSTAPPRPPDNLIARGDLQHLIVHLRERGVKPVTVHCWLRAMNAFCRWLYEQGATPDVVRVRPSKLEKRVLRVHGEAALRQILRYRPRTFIDWRVYAVSSTILDAGCRIDEVLSVPSADFDFDNLLVTLNGKGRKERRVPISVELRKTLFRYQQVKDRKGIKSPFMFPSRDGSKWHYRNARRSYYGLLKKIGLPRSGFHLLRHTFATQYLRNGGEVVRLSLILGHTEVSTTMKYLHLLTDDLQRPHQSL